MISVGEVNDKAARGEIRWFKRPNGKDAVCLQQIPHQSRMYNDGLPTPTTLTMKDSQLNAAGTALLAPRTPGFNRFGRRDDSIVGNAVDRSMSKVEAWSEVYDTRNVVICAGRVMQPISV